MCLLQPRNTLRFRVFSPALNSPICVAKAMSVGMSMSVLSVEQEQQDDDVPQPKLVRPCVDCGLITGNFCDGIGYECYAEVHVPGEDWCVNQRTPFCNFCESKRPACRFYMRTPSCTPPETSVHKGNDKPRKANPEGRMTID